MNIKKLVSIIKLILIFILFVYLFYVGIKFFISSINKDINDYKTAVNIIKNKKMADSIIMELKNDNESNNILSIEFDEAFESVSDDFLYYKVPQKNNNNNAVSNLNDSLNKIIKSLKGVADINFQGQNKRYIILKVDTQKVKSVGYIKNGKIRPISRNSGTYNNEAILKNDNKNSNSYKYYNKYYNKNLKYR